MNVVLMEALVCVCFADSGPLLSAAAVCVPALVSQSLHTLHSLAGSGAGGEAEGRRAQQTVHTC